MLTKWLGLQESGGEGGIRTLGTGVSPYNGLANRRIRPLCHLSAAGYPEFTTALPSEGSVGTPYQANSILLSSYAFHVEHPKLLLRACSLKDGGCCHRAGPRCLVCSYA